MEISKLWELCLEFEYGTNLLVEGLDEWMKTKTHNNILDCACGTGFPALNLIEKGYNFICSDGSTEMLSKFKSNANKRGISIQAHCIKWQGLADVYSNAFDIVFCRGNSLIYADGWDAERAPNENVIFNCLNNFRKCLKPGGVLYVDTTNEDNLSSLLPEHNAFGPSIINNTKVYLEETVTTDRIKKIRHWETTLTIDGTTHRFTRHSYYLSHEKLIRMLHECTFKQIEKVPIKGEKYAVFTASVN